jgi:ubiquinone/menaquinone biosynthesis C-methylase UbiE
MYNVRKYYDYLSTNNNDPLMDNNILKKYMDKWDGKEFIEEMKLSDNKTILEIGIGTGRLAVRIYNKCKILYGIDISKKTIERAEENLKNCQNIRLLIGDFLKYKFIEKYDVIYSSLTLMHIKNKKKALGKIYDLMNTNGRAVLSIDKNKQKYIIYDKGIKIRIYPDEIGKIKYLMVKIGFRNLNIIEKDFSIIISGAK